MKVLHTVLKSLSDPSSDLVAALLKVLIYRLHKYDHITEYYNRLHWLKFPHLINFSSVCTMFISTTPQEGFHFFLQFSLVANMTNYNTRTAPYFANTIRYNLTFTQIKIFSIQSHSFVEFLAI